jgi:hypothetical protein
MLDILLVNHTEEGVELIAGIGKIYDMEDGGRRVRAGIGYCAPSPIDVPAGCQFGEHASDLIQPKGKRGSSDQHLELA